jgi:hypothetical protein
VKQIRSERASLFVAVVEGPSDRFAGCACAGWSAREVAPPGALVFRCGVDDLDNRERLIVDRQGCRGVRENGSAINGIGGARKWLGT